MQDKWEIHSVAVDSSPYVTDQKRELAKYLEDGWEPYAVVQSGPSSYVKYFLRRNIGRIEAEALSDLQDMIEG